MSKHRAAASAVGRGSTFRFLLRLPAALHARLVAEATHEGLSLNAYCVQRLEGPDERVAPREHVAGVVAAATRVAGPHLVGVIAHGSWVRGEARDSSDIDVMVVIDRALPLTRRLYAAWDAEGPAWDGRQVDAHFVHLPSPSDRPSGLWCELAVEGLVLSDRGGMLSSALIDVRRAIARGGLVRKTAHGQPYWTEAA